MEAARQQAQTADEKRDDRLPVRPDQEIFIEAEQTVTNTQIVKDILDVSQEPAVVQNISAEDRDTAIRPQLKLSPQLSVENEIVRRRESADVARADPPVVSVDSAVAKAGKQVEKIDKAGSSQPAGSIVRSEGVPSTQAAPSLAVSPIEESMFTARGDSLVDELPDRIEVFSLTSVRPEESVSLVSRDINSSVDAEVLTEPAEPFSEPQAEVPPAFIGLDNTTANNQAWAELMRAELAESAGFEEGASHNPLSFKNEVITLLPSLEPARAEAAQELMNDLVLMIKESSQLSEVADEERQIIEEVIEELSGQLLTCFGETADEEIIRRFIEDIREAAVATVTDEFSGKPGIESLNYRGTYEYKSVEGVSLSSRLARFIGQKLQPHLALGRYTLQACLA